MYAWARKSITKKGKAKYLVELQPRAKNQQSADAVKASIGSIRKLFHPGNLSDKQRLKILDKLITKVTDPVFANYLNTTLRSSPTYIDMIDTHVGSTIQGNAKDQKYEVKKL